MVRTKAVTRSAAQRTHRATKRPLTAVQLRRVIVPARRRRPTQVWNACTWPSAADPILAGVRAPPITRRERKPGTEQLHDGLHAGDTHSASRSRSALRGRRRGQRHGDRAQHAGRAHAPLRTVVSAPPKPCSATNRSQIRFAVCRCCAAGSGLSSQLAMIRRQSRPSRLAPWPRPPIRPRIRILQRPPDSLALLWKSWPTRARVTPSWKCAHRIRSISAPCHAPPG